MSTYLVIFIISILFIISAFLLPRVPRNTIFGLRTVATLSDEEVWKISNKKASYLLYILGLSGLILDIFFYLSGFPEETFGNYLLMSLVISVVLVTVYLVIYSNNLWKKKNKGTKITSEVVLPRYFINIVGVLPAASFIVVGILMLFVPPNSLIGIRISKTLTNPELWQMVNRISGIGFILIGLVFSVLFFKDSLMEPELRTKNLKNHFLWFVVIIIFLSFIFVGLTYI
jgi:uncharacterized membrane protein